MANSRLKVVWGPALLDPKIKGGQALFLGPAGFNLA